MTIEDRLHELGIELAEVFPPAGKYVGAVRTGSLVFVSGAGPIRPDGSFVTGKVGRDVELDAAKDAARCRPACSCSRSFARSSAASTASRGW
jgi:enamine deaminase RidA (YjgF/YER057c/UK114 family)